MSNEQMGARAWRSLVPMMAHARADERPLTNFRAAVIRLIECRYAMRPHLRIRGIVTATHGDLLD